MANFAKITLDVLLISGLVIGSPAADLTYSGFSLPFADPKPVINAYRQPNSDYSAGHRGVDFEVAIGTEILAPADGEIWYSGQLVNRPVLSLRHGDELLTEFEPACSTLVRGQKIKRGQPIGFSCAGDANYRQHCDSCLHFSTRLNGEYLSPMYLLGQLNPSRLLSPKN